MKIAPMYFQVLKEKGRVFILNDKKFAEALRNQAHAKMSISVEKDTDIKDKENVIYTIYQ